MGRNKIILGTPLQYGDVLPDGGETRVFMGMSLASDGLEIDTLKSRKDTIDHRITSFLPRNSNGMELADGNKMGVLPMANIRVCLPSDHGYGQTVTFTRDDSLFAKFSLKSYLLDWGTIYNLSCQSSIGVLEDAIEHCGGVYDGVTAEWLIRDIIADIVPYTLDPSIASERIYGYLPISSRRNNLMQVLFALGANVFKHKQTGEMYIGTLDPNALPVASPKVYQIQKGDAEAVSASRVSILEHSYFEPNSIALEVLFEGETYADTVVSPVREMVNRQLSWVTKAGTMVTFDRPVIPGSLFAEGCNILASGANFAVLSPSVSARLHGLYYVHTTRQITRPAQSAGQAVSVSGKEISVKDATLVSVINSENVADRVYSYYRNSQVVKADMAVEGQRPGDKITFTDATGRTITGLIKSMDINLSNTLKAAVEVVTGYTPTGIGNFYSTFVPYTTSGTFTVPSGVHKIRVVLIGGGEGGASGYPGNPGTHGTNKSNQDGEGGLGGEPGRGGRGGKILVVTLDVAPGQQFNINIGAAGRGGVCDGVTSVQGTEGGATTIGSYTSADGVSSEIGFVDILSGMTYGSPGYQGFIPGGNGSGKNGNGGTIEINGTIYRPGANGVSVANENGYGGCGYGGGAAYLANGNPGTNGICDSASSKGGVGGDGADAGPTESATTPGCGGDGGCGGGGGGAGGGAYHVSPLSSTSGARGNGGLGGRGGDGAPGFAGIYY